MSKELDTADDARSKDYDAWIKAYGVWIKADDAYLKIKQQEQVK